MKRLSALFGTVLFVLLAAAASPARADYLNWSYTASPNVPGISVGGASAIGGASVTLTDFNNPQPGAASIPVVAYVTSSSNSTPVSFNNSAFNLALTISDNTTHDSGTLNFTGSLAGSLSATTSSVIASFAPVASNSLTLDGHTYTVTIPSSTLAAPTSPQKDIMALVSVTNGGGSPPPPPPPPPPHVNSTPEPASLLLGSLGISCLGIRRWWKRRRLTRTIANA